MFKKSALVLTLFTACLIQYAPMVHADQSRLENLAEVKFKNADTVVTQLHDLRAAINNFYDQNAAWPINFNALIVNGFYTGRLDTPFDSAIVGSISADGKSFVLSVDVGIPEVAEYIGRNANGQSQGNLVTYSVPMPVTQAITNTFISRFYDPSRPDLNQMSTNLNLGNNNINDIGIINTNIINGAEFNSDVINNSGKITTNTLDAANSTLTNTAIEVATINDATIEKLTNIDADITNATIATGNVDDLTSKKLRITETTIIDGSLTVNATSQFLNDVSFQRPVTMDQLTADYAAIATLEVTDGEIDTLKVVDLSASSSTVTGNGEFGTISVNGLSSTNGIRNDGSFVNLGGIDNVGGIVNAGGIENAGGLTTDTLTTSGLATLTEAEILTKLLVGGSTQTNGIQNAGSITSNDLNVTGNTILTKAEIIDGLLVNGGLNVDTINSTGLASIESLAVANNLSVNGVANTNGITNNGNIQTTTLNTTGAASLDSATVAKTLNVNGATTTNGLSNTGNIQTTTLNTTGTASLDSATVAKTLNVNGATTTNGLSNTGNIQTTTLSTSGAASLNSAIIDNDLSVNGKAHTRGITNVGTVSSTYVNTGGLTTSGRAVLALADVETNLTVKGRTNTKDIVNSGSIDTATLNTSGLATLSSAKILTSLVVDGAASLNGGATIKGDLNIGNSNTKLSQSVNGMLRIKTPTGYVDIGSANTSFAHFKTDRDYFHFDKLVAVTDAVEIYGTGTKLSAGSLNLAGSSSATIDIRANGGAALINFSNDSTSAYDARLILVNDDLLELRGANFQATDITATGDLTAGGDIYGRYQEGSASNLFRFGGLYLTWDSNSYGTNEEHSIRSTYGDVAGDSITINSFNNIRFNLDTNDNNPNSKFEIGAGSTGTSNTLFSVDENGNTIAAGKVTANGGYGVIDTRANNYAPNTYNKSVSYEFKSSSAVGIAGVDSYSGLMTFAPWQDDSGGDKFQLGFSSKNNQSILNIRNGDSAGWRGWTRLLTEDAADDRYYTRNETIEINSTSHAAIELRSLNGGTSIIDFSNDPSVDYDARLQLIDNNTLSVIGATLDATVGFRTKTFNLNDRLVMSTSSDGRVWFAPKENNGSWNYDAEFGYNPNGSLWYAEGGMQIIDSGRVLFKAENENVTVYQAGSTAWTVNGGNILHYKPTDFKEVAYFRKGLSVLGGTLTAGNANFSGKITSTDIGINGYPSVKSALDNLSQNHVDHAQRLSVIEKWITECEQGVSTGCGSGGDDSGSSNGGDPTATIKAGCYVDTTAYDVAQQVCFGYSSQTSGKIVFSVGNAISHANYTFDDASKWTVSWTGDCVSSSYQCTGTYLFPRFESTYRATVKATHKSTGKIFTRTVMATVESTGGGKPN